MVEFLKVRTYKSAKGKHTEKLINMPKTAEGYYRREVSPDGMTITYRKVA